MVSLKRRRRSSRRRASRYTYTISKSHGSDRADFDALHRTADSLTPELRKAWEAITKSFTTAISLADLEAAVLAGNDAAIISASNDAFASIGVHIEDVLDKAVTRAGNVAADRLAVDLSFDVLNPRTALYAETRAATLVVESTAEQQAAIRAVLSDGVLTGRSAPAVARDLRSTIGLHERWSNAVVKFRGGLENQGLAAGRVNTLTDKYAAKLLRTRADTIARTELIRAANIGQREAWVQAVNEGQLPAEGVEREWVAALDGRTDPVCADLDETRVAFDDEFEFGDPPIHPRCRCSIGLIT